MSSYIVGPMKEIEWEIDLGFFIENLLQKWPDITFKREKREIRGAETVSWEVKIGANSLYCWLHPTHNTISMEGGDLEDYVQIALWFRMLVPRLELKEYQKLDKADAI